MEISHAFGWLLYLMVPRVLVAHVWPLIVIGFGVGAGFATFERAFASTSPLSILIAAGLFMGVWRILSDLIFWERESSYEPMTQPALPLSANFSVGGDDEDGTLIDDDDIREIAGIRDDLRAGRTKDARDRLERWLDDVAPDWRFVDERRNPDRACSRAPANVARRKRALRRDVSAVLCAALVFAGRSS